MNYLEACQEILNHECCSILYAKGENNQLVVLFYPDRQWYPAQCCAVDLNNLRAANARADAQLTVGDLVLAKIFPGNPVPELCIVEKDYGDALRLGLVLVRPLAQLVPELPQRARETYVTFRAHCRVVSATTEHSPQQPWDPEGGPSPHNWWSAYGDASDSILDQQTQTVMESGTLMTALHPLLGINPQQEDGYDDHIFRTTTLNWFTRMHYVEQSNNMPAVKRAQAVYVPVSGGVNLNFDRLTKPQEEAELCIIVDDLGKNDLGIIVVHRLTPQADKYAPMTPLEVAVPFMWCTEVHDGDPALAPFLTESPYTNEEGQ